MDSRDTTSRDEADAPLGDFRFQQQLRPMPVRDGCAWRQWMTDLDSYFDVGDYVVLGFYVNTLESCFEAADLLGLAPHQRLPRGDAPYVEIRKDAPQITGSTDQCRWITLDVLRHQEHGHDVGALLADEDYKPSQPAVLLWRRSDDLKELHDRRDRARAIRVAEARTLVGRQQAYLEKRKAAARKGAAETLGEALGGEPLTAFLRRLVGLPLFNDNGEPLTLADVDDDRAVLQGSSGVDTKVLLEDAWELAIQAAQGYPIGVDDHGAAVVAAALPGAELADGTLEIHRVSERVGLDLGELDRTVLVRVRQEQRIARQVVFGNAGLSRCALCGERYTTDLLVAAHIKPRSRADDSERRDLENILMPACLLGCDALYERGYVAVTADGRVEVSDEILGPGVAARLAEYAEGLAGRVCPDHAAGSAGYFAWHEDTIFRR